MTRSRVPDRDRVEVDALVADRYLDALLAAGDRRADDAPADAALDPGLREAARVLRRSLVRVHPSFRFEERLAGRLADLAASRSAAGSAAPGGAILPFAGRLPAPGRAAIEADPLLDAILRGHLDPTDADALERAGSAPVDRRPLLVGGAITSAAISIAGVVWVAWRASHPGGRSGVAMGRAARFARARRAAALAGSGLGRPA